MPRFIRERLPPCVAYASLPALWPAAALAVFYACLAFGPFRGTAPESGLAANFVLAATLVALSAIDIETYRLPDLLTLPLVAFGVVHAWLLTGDAIWSLASAAIGYGSLHLVIAAYRAVRGADGLGLGDAKLFAASGAWLGAECLPTVLLAASASGLAWVLLGRLMGRRTGLVERIPFGPHLALGTWVVWLNGPL